MNRLTTPSLAILATLAMGFNFGVANAEPSATVVTRDLDLRKAQDVATLYSRIERKANQVCADAAAPWDASRMTYIRKCVAGAMDAAVAGANNDALTALHEAKRRNATKVAGNLQK